MIDLYFVDRGSIWTPSSVATSTTFLGKGEVRILARGGWKYYGTEADEERTFAIKLTSPYPKDSQQVHRLRAQSGTECTQMVRNIWTLPGIHKDDEDLRSIEQTSLHVFNVCNVNIKGLIKMI